ncbi:mariner Mos1 transposase [Trichonephila clavipes]|nr:mariner Mos1 transposase [Trichonephila clavipes]
MHALSIGSNGSDLSRIRAAFTILVMRSMSDVTSVFYAGDFMYPNKKKSMGGERGQGAMVLILLNNLWKSTDEMSAHVGTKVRKRVITGVIVDDDPTQSQRQLAKALNMSQERINRRLRAMGKINKLAKDTLKSLGLDILPHPPYFPDLAPSNHHLLASMGHALAEQHFSNFEEIRKWLDEWFAAKDKQFFWHGIHKLPER